MRRIEWSKCESEAVPGLCYLSIDLTSAPNESSSQLEVVSHISDAGLAVESCLVVEYGLVVKAALVVEDNLVVEDALVVEAALVV